MINRVRLGLSPHALGPLHSGPPQKSDMAMKEKPTMVHFPHKRAVPSDPVRFLT